MSTHFTIFKNITIYYLHVFTHIYSDRLCALLRNITYIVSLLQYYEYCVFNMGTFCTLFIKQYLFS